MNPELSQRRWIPLSALEHFAYCTRQAALIHGEGYFAADLNMVRGDLAHAAVDRPGVGRDRRQTTIWRSLPVWSDEIGIHGICDVVEFRPDGPVPIEHKSGAYRPGGPADLQVAAQVLCLREMFHAPIPRGIVFSGRQRTRHDVLIDDALTARVHSAVTDLRALLDSATTPAPVNDHRCRRCSLRPGCLPEQPRTVLATLFTPRPERMWMTELLTTLFVTTPGTSLHLDGDAIRVYQSERPGRHLIPLPRIDHIVVWNGVSLTDDLLHRCAADARSVTWVTRNGRFLARVSGPQTGTPQLRLAQYRTHDNSSARLGIARSIVAGKLHNYRQLLLKAARDTTGARQRRLRAVATDHATALSALPAASTLHELLGIEGQAGRGYFQALDHLAPGVQAGRSRRPPRDPANCLLSFGYGMLRVAVHGALEQVGLDPTIGYLHGVRAGKPGLALDLMEEFRPLLVDRLVLTLINRGQLNDRHTQTLPGGAVELTDHGRRFFLEQWSLSRARTWPHAGLGRTVEAGLLPLLQARLLARHLRGDTDDYQPWTLT